MENNPLYSDEDLLLQVAQGSQAAFRLLYDRYRNKIFSISCKIIGTRSAAEDVVQDVFIKLWLKKESLPEIEHFEAYLNVMARNHIFNYLRKIANEKSFFQKPKIKPVQQNNEGLDKVCYKELESLVQKTIDLLPPQQKKAYNFSRIDGLKHEEIAERMGISKSTVKGHIIGALNQIKNAVLSGKELIILMTLINIHSIL